MLVTDDDLIRAGRAWTANVADGNLTQALAAMRAVLTPMPAPQAEPTDGLRIALDALDEIALAGMSGTGQESEEGMRARHARQAWAFIGIAARAKSAIAALPAPSGEPAAWMDPAAPRDPIGAAKKRDLETINGAPGRALAAKYTIPLYAAAQAAPAPQAASPAPAVPAGWRIAITGGDEVLVSAPPDGPGAMTIPAGGNGSLPVRLLDALCRAIAAPQEAPAPLTDEQIEAAWDSVDMRHPRGNATRIAFARAVLAAAGITATPAKE